MAQNSLVALRHPRERLPQPAPQILHTEPKINLQHGRFYISAEEFELRVSCICFQLWKIQKFAKFVTKNYRKIKERQLVFEDLDMFVEFFSIFLTKEFVDPKGMFRKIYRQHPFEFLLIFDLCWEK